MSRGGIMLSNVLLSTVQRRTYCWPSLPWLFSAITRFCRGKKRREDNRGTLHFCHARSICTEQSSMFKLIPINISIATHLMPHWAVTGN